VIVVFALLAAGAGATVNVAPGLARSSARRWGRGVALEMAAGRARCRAWCGARPARWPVMSAARP
jgi:hypothetical protein